MKINEKIHGFIITNIRQTSGGEFIEMIHEKTAARLVWMNNGDENKLFSISFKTVPWDDTGVFHILEHSVLGGSERYPVKEPFLYLLKGSMNTFLNAMTFPDKTMFPVSSRNAVDFMNLARVYLDAVFKPAIYTDPNIFYQEGHHIEWLDDGNAPLYKGVVFNEMKGVDSSVHDRIESEIIGMLFPESCYRFEYGGRPSAIPELTYEQFIEAHRRFYHPSNSYIYIDGAVDLAAVTELLDSYLSEYDVCADLPEINVQIPVSSCEKESFYEIAPEEEEEMHTYLAAGKILGSWEDREKIFACSVLCEAIASSNDAPFKRAILDTGLCLDVSLDISDNIMQPFGVLKISNIEKENGRELLAAVKSTAERLVKNGIGKEFLLAAINRCEFRFRESEEPKALTRCIDAMSSWLYGGDPLYYIECGDIFDSLREKAETGYFEELLSEWLIDENGRMLLYMLPSRTYGEEQRRMEQQRLDSHLEAMNEEEKAALIRLNRGLAEWQATPDTPEAVATLPTLPLSEVSAQPMDYVTEVSAENGFTVLNHSAKDPEIVSVGLYFAADDLTVEELRILELMERIICELPTKKSTGEELQWKIMGTLGGLETEIISIGKPDIPEECRVFFAVRTRFLARNLIAAQELIGELLTETSYDSTELITEILKQDDEELKQDIIAAGHRFSLRRARSVMSAESAVSELVSGFEWYKYLHSVVENGEDKIAVLREKIISLSKRILCKARLTASVTSMKKRTLDVLADILPEGEASSADTMKIKLNIPEKQGIIIPAGVSYSGAVPVERSSDKALWSVLSTILSYEYLWNEIRVKGGAYGTGCGCGKTGEIGFYSYRDPSPEESIDIYERAGEFLREYCEGEPDISSYIISSIAAEEPILSDSGYGYTADDRYFRGITFEERVEIRRKQLAMTCEELLKGASDLKKFASYCIIGSKEALVSCAEKGYIIESV